ncbi:MAG TPA: MMPL family transporter [Chitinophagaceae bacterium]|nr:MMPL family transporter [Chitinophagaceae bacterium]
MWFNLAKFILRFKVPLLIFLIAATAFMGYEASKVQMSYEFSKAIPTDNEKYIEYQAFRQKFGDDGNTLVLGIESPQMYTIPVFNAAGALHKRLKKVPGVLDILSVPEASNFIKDSITGTILPQKLFHYPYSSRERLDSDRAAFEALPFYKGLLYNPATHAYLMGVQLNKDSVNSKARTALVNNILKEVKTFENSTNVKVHISGLPFIRTNVANRIAREMNWFLTGSLILSAITLLLFFRSFSATVMSLLVVGMGVVFSLGTMVLFDYKITLLTAIIPSLVVVIGVPNCIYFLNKYHTSYREKGDKQTALITMIGRMGVVTLFCNIAAAIGFTVFAFTRSDLLKEFGVVSGINIMMLFFISLIFIPSVLSFLPPPKTRHVRYLENKTLERLLVMLERWAFNHSGWIYGITAGAVVVAIIGMTKLKKEGFIVDDLPKHDIVYTDLKWFEQNFDGIMPLEIIVDTKRKNALKSGSRAMRTIEKIDSLSRYIDKRPETARPLSYVEGLKYLKQILYGGDSSEYHIPTEYDMPFIAELLGPAKADSSAKNNTLNKMLSSFIDSNKQVARISVNMKDIGSAKLPLLLNDLDSVVNKTFDTANYRVTITGGSITFLEGSAFIIEGLKESIIWAFVLIAICMLYLFRSARILLCSLIPNIVPLLITAGVMGWAGIALKPSTVLVFSVALGIAIDVTIRFLVNYKQELPHFNFNVPETLKQTIRHTGISIIYTSLVLIAGFVIFCISQFGGTKALGWLTSLTLVVGTITNLTLLPVLIKALAKKKNSSRKSH